MTLDVVHGFHEPFPYAGRDDTAAGKITGQQVFRVLPQKAVQAVHLAGCAGKQHETSLLQIHLRLLVGFAQLALDGLDAPQHSEILFIFYGHMAHLQLFIHCRAEYHAAALQRKFRQRRKRAAGRRLGPHRLILVPYNKRRRLAAHLPLLQHRAHMSAVAAADTAVGDLRIQKALAVTHHMDGTLGTAAAARAAAGTEVPGRQLRLCRLRHGTRLLAQWSDYGIIVAQSRVIGNMLLVHHVFFTNG